MDKIYHCFGIFRNWRAFEGRFFKRALGSDLEPAAFEHPKLKHFIAEHAHPSLKVGPCKQSAHLHTITEFLCIKRTVKKGDIFPTKCR